MLSAVVASSHHDSCVMFAAGTPARSSTSLHRSGTNLQAGGGAKKGVEVGVR